jgi:hypothetical protein
LRDFKSNDRYDRFFDTFRSMAGLKELEFCVPDYFLGEFRKMIAMQTVPVFPTVQILTCHIYFSPILKHCPSLKTLRLRIYPSLYHDLEKENFIEGTFSEYLALAAQHTSLERLELWSTTICAQKLRGEFT